MQILETPRLVLRHQEPSDLDDLWRIYSDPEVVRYIPDAPRTRDEARLELEWHRHGHARRPELGLWATIHKATGTFIGRCGLLPWTLDGRDEVEVAYLIDKPYWGQGLGTEAALGIRDYALRHLGLGRLVCLITPGNAASERVAHNLGMKLEKEMADEFGPFLLYSLAQ